MYKRPKLRTGSLEINESTQGETIEEKVERIVNNNEPIKDGAPLLYTERKEGIRPSTNIRTDRFEIAIDAADKIQRSYQAKREERHNTAEKPPENGGAESLQGGGETPTN